MRRHYNRNLTPEQNRVLNQRYRTVYIEKSLLILSAILLLSLAIIACSASHVLANDSSNRIPTKHYTSIVVEEGETLWSIADHYTEGTDIEVEDYVDSIAQLNHIPADQIHAGSHLVVAYYE